MAIFVLPRAVRRLPARPLIFIALLACALSASSKAQRGPGNAQFLRYPFDKWASENAKSQIKWTARVSPARLSPHQRLVTQLSVSIEADELRKHAGSAEILVFLRVEDSAGHRFQTGSQTPVTQLHHGDRFLELDYSASAFVLPGDYTVSLAVCDSSTLEHSFVRRALHVAEINSDPLPKAWKELPSVEFLPSGGNPDAWYLPRMRSSIALPFETARPMRVELLVNTTPSTPASVNTFRQNMELIVPSLKVLIGLNPGNGSIGLNVIDLNRRSLSYRQTDLHPANRPWTDWPQLRSAFNELGGATVDATTLAGQRQMLDYFAAEATLDLNSHLDGSAGPADDIAHVLIVLSAPVFLTEQEKPPPPDLPPDPRHRVFYISYSPTAIVRFPASPPAGRSGPGTVDPGPDAEAAVHRPLYIFSDDLEHLLKPMGARVFHVSKPEEFRKAVGAILDEIAKM